MAAKKATSTTTRINSRKVVTKTVKRAVIHVNRQFIAINAKLGKPVLPVYTAKLNGPNSKPVYAYSIKFNGPGELADPRTNSQLSCGARAWIEVEGELRIIGPMTFAEADKLRKRVSARL